jgi:hypothetical protein
MIYIGYNIFIIGHNTSNIPIPIQSSSKFLERRKGATIHILITRPIAHKSINHIINPTNVPYDMLVFCYTNIMLSAVLKK